MDLHKTRTSTVAWAPPTKIGYFAHRPKTELTNIFFAGKAHATFLLVTKVV